MNIRKIASLTATLAFLVMLLTSIVLFIVPHGRIAYWADWRLLGLSKTQWGDIHINTGFLFLIALGFHIYYNWKSIVNYLKDKARKIKVFTKDFNIAAVLVLVCIFGTYFSIPPFSSILNISADIKDAAAEHYGEPPYGHAELSSLQTFAKKMKLDVNESINLLKKAGFDVENEKQTLVEISRQNHISPQQIYSTIKTTRKAAAAESSTGAKMLPELPPVGMGNTKLLELCNRYDLKIKQVITSLKKQNIIAQENMTIKQIAQKNNTNPMDIYELLRKI